MNGTPPELREHPRANCSRRKRNYAHFLLLKIIEIYLTDGRPS